MKVQAAESILDPNAWQELQFRVGGDAQLLAELVSLYLAEAKQRFAEMHRAVAVGDAAALRLAAHSLKSNSAEFGALTLAELCRELEMMGRAGTVEGADPILDRAERLFTQVQEALEARLR